MLNFVISGKVTSLIEYVKRSKYSFHDFSAKHAPSATWTNQDAVTEKSATPSLQVFYFKSNLRIFFKANDCDAQFQILLTPQKFTCIDINTEPPVNQNETMQVNLIDSCILSSVRGDHCRISSVISTRDLLAFFVITWIKLIFVSL